MREDETLRESTLAEDRKEAYDRGYQRGYAEGQNATLNIENTKKHESKFDIDTEDYDQGFKDGQASLAKAYADGKGGEMERQRGRDEAWEAVRTLWCNYKVKDLKLLFDGHDTVSEIIRDYSASEAIEKLKAYEEEQNRIKVGDEVYTRYDGAGNYLDRGFVLRVDDGLAHNITVVSKTGSIYGDHDKSRWHKTGRHFDQISEVLEQMKEE